MKHDTVASQSTFNVFINIEPNELEIPQMALTFSVKLALPYNCWKLEKWFQNLLIGTFKTIVLEENLSKSEVHVIGLFGSKNLSKLLQKGVCVYDILFRPTVFTYITVFKI